jgi:hypothetical protein
MGPGLGNAVQPHPLVAVKIPTTYCKPMNSLDHDFDPAPVGE